MAYITQVAKWVGLFLEEIVVIYIVHCAAELLLHCLVCEIEEATAEVMKLVEIIVAIIKRL